MVYRCRPANDKASAKYDLAQNRDLFGSHYRDLRWDGKQVVRHARRLDADRIWETNRNLRLIIRQTASVGRADWSAECNAGECSAWLRYCMRRRRG